MKKFNPLFVSPPIWAWYLIIFTILLLSYQKLEAFDTISSTQRYVVGELFTITS